MREVLTGRDDRLPPPMFREMGSLPWMRRERIDGYLRKAQYELEALMEEGDGYKDEYETLAHGCGLAVACIGEIEDAVDESLTGHSIRVNP
jgi:hypothetical protein